MALLANVSLISLTTALKLIDTNFTFQAIPFHRLLALAPWKKSLTLGFKHKIVLRVRVEC